jgi:hypothetical protein
MYTQLPYTIAKQHQAELVQASDRARLVAQGRTQRTAPHPTSTISRFRGLVASVLAQAAPRA